MQKKAFRLFDQAASFICVVARQKIQKKDKTQDYLLQKEHFSARTPVVCKQKNNATAFARIKSDLDQVDTFQNLS